MTMKIRIALLACLLPFAAAGANIGISPSSPHALDSVRLQYTEGGTFVLDPDATQVTMAGNRITVTLQYGGALSPPPPARTNEFFLGQFPEGTYQVDVLLAQGTGATAVGSTSFTVTARPATGRPYADLTDLWWNASESGWGLDIVQHPSDNLFMTLFVYGANGQPAWYVVPGGTWDGPNFNGVVYRTTGPVVGDTFDPGAVARTPVGSVHLAVDTFSGDAYQAFFQLGAQTFGRTIARQPF